MICKTIPRNTFRAKCVIYSLVLSSVVICGESFADFEIGWFAFNHYDYKTARLEFTNSAVQENNPVAQYYLGEIYEGGIAVDQDYGKAIYWYTKSAHQDYGKAQARLASMYLRGIGTKLNYSNAFRWYTRAAENGEVLAQSALAVLYANGEGVKKDISNAYKWWSIAASYGDPDALEKRGRIENLMTATEISKAITLADEWEKDWEQNKLTSLNSLSTF